MWRYYVASNMTSFAAFGRSAAEELRRHTLRRTKQGTGHSFHATRRRCFRIALHSVGMSIVLPVLPYYYSAAHFAVIVQLIVFGTQLYFSTRSAIMHDRRAEVISQLHNPSPVTSAENPPRKLSKEASRPGATSHVQRHAIAGSFMSQNSPSDVSGHRPKESYWYARMHTRLASTTTARCGHFVWVCFVWVCSQSFERGPFALRNLVPLACMTDRDTITTSLRA